uniref:PyrC6 n=1 Tax=Streptomyces rugosporus TaxID=295838 RepID=K7QVV1_STRRG|nr:PyrC6 [Streptomyces rugosporus]
MKALVLAGGHGTRLRPFSHSVPKQLVPVAGKPVLFHALEALRSAGVTEAGVIVSGAGLPIRAALGDGAALGLQVTYLPQETPSGLAACVKIGRDFLGDDDFVMYLGDNIFGEGVDGPVDGFRRRRSAAQLLVTKVADPTQYGVAELDGHGRVIALEEKPARPASNLAVTGLYCFTAAIHEAVDRIVPSRRGELEITDAVRWLVDHGHDVRAEVLGGYWADTGTLDDLLECNKTLLDRITPAMHGRLDDASTIVGPVVVEAGAVIERSTVVGPALIGAGSTVVDSHVGRFTALGRDCDLRDARVEHSILMDRASVHGVRLAEGSIVGAAGEVRHSRRETAGHRVLVGDDSLIEVAQ